MAQTRQRPMRGWELTLERFAASRAGGWYFINVANKIDKHLVPATRGRMSSAVGQQVLVVETIGAKSGQARRIPLVYVVDGEAIVLIASKGGAPKHGANRAWYPPVCQNTAGPAPCRASATSAASALPE